MIAQIWALLDQQFSHGKQKTGARGRGAGAVKRAVSGGPYPAAPSHAVESIRPAAAAVDVDALPSDQHHLGFEGIGVESVRATSGFLPPNELVYSEGPSSFPAAVSENTAAAAPEAAAAGAAAAAAVFSETLEGGLRGSEKATGALVQQTTNPSLLGPLPTHEALTSATTGGPRGPIQATWQGEGERGVTQGEACDIGSRQGDAPEGL